MYESTRAFAEDFLGRIRGFVESEKLSVNRLPKWVKSAKVKIAKLNNSNLFLVEDSLSERDVIVDCGVVRSDLQFFLDLPDYAPKAASFRAPDKQSTGLIILQGEYGEGRQVVLNITSSDSALFNVGYIPYHSPLAVVNIFVQLSVSGEVLAIRFIPFAIYAHDSDVIDSEGFWRKCTPHLQDTLRFIHHSEAGNYYQKTAESKSAVLVGKEKSVIVFGKYREPEVSELIQVRDSLRAKNYDAYLLRDLPEHPSMSLEEKVKLWALASRFCVMIDREPAGHLVEYSYLKSETVILALLRPEDGGSTTMIEDNPIDFPFIKTFKFKGSPLEVIDSAVTWAEGYIKERIKAK